MNLPPTIIENVKFIVVYVVSFQPKDHEESDSLREVLLIVELTN